MVLEKTLKNPLDSVQFSLSVMSDSLWPHELQHTRPPCPSPTPEFTQTHVHWVGDAIQPSHPLSSPYPPAFSLSQHQHQGPSLLYAPILMSYMTTWKTIALNIWIFVGKVMSLFFNMLSRFAGDLGWEDPWVGKILGLERSPGEWKGYLDQYSGLENSMDCLVHGVAKSWTCLRYFHFSGLSQLFFQGASVLISWL